jgi:Protein involved in formate dehydrogenase formation
VTFAALVRAYDDTPSRASEPTTGAAVLRAVPTLASPRSTTVRSTLAEQYAPVLRAHAEIRAECMPLVDVEHAQSRIRNGQIGYDALRVLRSCGDPMPYFARVLEAFEVAGFLSNDDRRSLLERELDVDDLVSGWFTGDRTPRDSSRRVARQAAIVVGNALLRTASALVEPASTWREWTRIVCPCCGGSPDIALRERGAQRTLVCARCDAQWRTAHQGCLSCRTVDEPTIARITNAEVGYDLVMCNGCGRFLKERPRRGIESLIVERALTTELDLAAEHRGLRI